MCVFGGWDGGFGRGAGRRNGCGVGKGGVFSVLCGIVWVGL